MEGSILKAYVLSDLVFESVRYKRETESKSNKDSDV
jgi:hypothetical protein